ncbi:MAG TPA: M48 family metallopeptidase [Patescibacteria group bacterium]|nr:M48 family metallopeptidase [Patescibacteria group bacterium]
MLTYTEITRNKRESWLLITVFLVIIIALGYLFAVVYDNQAILYFAVGFSVFSSLISYYFSDSITLAMSHAQEVDRQTAPELYRIVENLCIAAGLPAPRIYIVNDPSPNAFATGRDPKHAVVCATTGILQKMDKTELEGVIAHELSHIGNYDIRVMTMVVVLVGTITLLSDWFLRFGFLGGGRRRGRDGEGGQILAILAVVGLIFAILSPIIATLIKLAVSRHREYLADASGALLTRYPEGLARALEKIAADEEPLAHSNNATAHLYFASPFKSDTKSGSRGHWLANLFNTHPPIEERIKRLRQMNLG